jgi:hypothetical protein
VCAASDVGVGSDPDRRAKGADRQLCRGLEEKQKRTDGRYRQMRSSTLGRLPESSEVGVCFCGSVSAYVGGGGLRVRWRQGRPLGRGLGSILGDNSELIECWWDGGGQDKRRECVRDRVW